MKHDLAILIRGPGALALLVLLAGCVSYAPTYRSYGHADSGVYIQDAPRYAGAATAGYVDPSFYPYWSLDHFYFGGFHRHHGFYSPAFSYYPAPLYRSPFHGPRLTFGFSLAYGHPAHFGYPIGHGFHRHRSGGFLYLSRTLHRPDHRHRPHHQRDHHDRHAGHAASADPRRGLDPGGGIARRALLDDRAARSRARARGATAPRRSRATIVRTTPHPGSRSARATMRPAMQAETGRAGLTGRDHGSDNGSNHRLDNPRDHRLGNRRDHRLGNRLGNRPGNRRDNRAAAGSARLRGERARTLPRTFSRNPPDGRETAPRRDLSRERDSAAITRGNLRGRATSAPSFSPSSNRPSASRPSSRPSSRSSNRPSSNGAERSPRADRSIRAAAPRAQPSRSKARSSRAARIERHQSDNDDGPRRRKRR